MTKQDLIDIIGGIFLFVILSLIVVLMFAL